MSIVAAPPPPIHLKPSPSQTQSYPSTEIYPKHRPQHLPTATSELSSIQAQGSPESIDSGSSTFSYDSPGRTLSASTPSGSGDLPDSTNQITKDWSVPSRPKPGRKPAADTPPTKRKAQNRAAQRAFRQRRAAEVGDLQEQLNQKQDEYDKKEEQWEVEKQRYQQNVEQWRKNAEYWQEATNREQARVKELEIQIQDLQNQFSQPHQSHRHNSHGGNASVLPSLVTESASSWNQSPSTPATLQIEKSAKDITSSTTYHQSPSQITNAQVSMNTVENSGLENSRLAEEEMEIDFTSMFAKPVIQNSSNVLRQYDNPLQQDFGTLSMILPLPVDSCGFCDPGGLCVCKEIAAESAVDTTGPEQTITLPSMSSIIQPMNMTSNVKAQIMEPRATATGPGSCPACMADPERASFCRSLAGLMPPPPLPRSTSSTSSIVTPTETSNKRRRIGCANQLISNDPGGCQSKKLTCAETFNRLKQIPNFREHKDEIIHHLTAEPAKGDEYCEPCDQVGCAPLAVDSATFDAAILLTGLKDPTNFAGDSTGSTKTAKQSRKDGKGQRQKYTEH